MRHYTNLLFYAFAMFLCFSSQVAAKDTPETIIQEFWRIYADENPRKAVNFLFGTNPVFNSKAETINKFNFEIDKLARFAGDFIDADNLTGKYVSGKVYVSVNLAYYEKVPIRFKFFFYKPETEWLLYSVKFDEDLDDDLFKLLLQKWITE